MRLCQAFKGLRPAPAPAVLVDVLGELCPGLRHVEEGDFAGGIRDRLRDLGAISRVQPVAGGRFPR